jgi:hypothetical protein
MEKLIERVIEPAAIYCGVAFLLLLIALSMAQYF